MHKDPELFYAHSENKKGIAQRLSDHLRNVAELAAGFASDFDAAEEAYLAGIFHDLGKYSERFQRRLKGKEKGLDHWSIGAWHTLCTYRMIAAALSIQGHHIGLQKADKDSLRALDPKKLASSHPLNLELTDKNLNVLIQRFFREISNLPSLTKGIYPSIQDTASAMLDVRMLFSTLVDADFLDTARHFELEEDNIQKPSLEPERALEIVQKHVQHLSRTQKSSPEMCKIRNTLWLECLRAGNEPHTLCTLTAPTGAGKTLAMLGFALQHAIKYHLRRIIVVIPYLSIIEQTAKIYRDLFSPCFDNYFLIEHHSLTGTRAEPEPDRTIPDAEEEAKQVERTLSENWDAPIVLTTSVQFLESLFSNRPSACRKLHRIARSVVLFDEVQTLPIHLTIPTLKTLSRLAERYQTTILFSTATQPAFDHLNLEVKEPDNRGWLPREIVSNVKEMFAQSRRTQVEWPDLDARLSWQQIAEQLLRTHNQQALCVVNLKRHAYELTRLLIEEGAENVFHLSTWMCPKHRQSVLKTVQERLKQNLPCLLISTQCIEVGVDVDFPVVFRAFAPLDSIAQAAGRCNRHGKQSKGRLILFIPEDEKYPPGAYEQAAAITRLYLKKLGTERADIYDPSFFEGYYRELYDFTNPERMSENLQSAIKRQDFVEVAKTYKLIDEHSINLLVPWEEAGEIYKALSDEVLLNGLSAHWIRRAKPYVVGLYLPRPDDETWQYVQKIPICSGHYSEEWYIYLEPSHYDKLLGLLPCKQPPVYLY